MAALVLDASVVLAWSIAEECSAQADVIEEIVHRDGAEVPSHFFLEVAGAVLKGEREKKLTREDAREIAIGVESLACMVDQETSRRAFHDTMELAYKHGLTLYDAAYLELAIRRKLRLATLDKKLNDAACAEDVAMMKLAS
jgi:predicted nucleic acid-binding protein